jgi:DNA primase
MESSKERQVRASEGGGQAGASGVRRHGDAPGRMDSGQRAPERRPHGIAPNRSALGGSHSVNGDQRGREQRGDHLGGANRPRPVATSGSLHPGPRPTGHPGANSPTRRQTTHPALSPRPSRAPRPCATIPEHLLQTLRERVRITDLFQAGELKPRGSEFLTLCPWHADTNASLTVSPRTNRVHCFVCHRGADAIGWLQDRQGLTFSEAVRELASRHGLALPEADPQAAAQAEALQRERQRLLAWRDRQQHTFHQALLDDLGRMGPAAIAVAQRGLTAETAKSWGLGLNGGRLMLPLRDPLGRCVAFSGRSLTGEEPKYRNSANDALFHKAELLFTLDRAAPAFRRGGEALLVEGPLDAIQLHQAGLEHAVASLGTAFSLEQAQRLVRCGAKRLWVAYDGDRAGQQAAARVVSTCRTLAIGGQLDLPVVPLPAGEDPDSVLRQRGPEALRECINRASHWLEWELDRLLEALNREPGDLSLLQQAERAGSDYLALLPKGVLRHRAEQRLRGALEGFCAASSPVAAARPRSQELTDRGGTPSQEEAILMAERRALRLYLHNPELREVLAVLALSNPLHREAMGCLLLLDQRLRESNRPDRCRPETAGEDGLMGLLLDSLPLLDPPVAALLAPMARCGDLLRKRLKEQAGEELRAVLDVLEGGG